MKKTRAFALVETLIVSTIIATILMYIFIQFNKVEGMYDESFAYNDVDNLYKLDSIKGYIDSLDNSSVINITAKINSDDIIIMDRNEDTYSNIEYLDNQVDLLNNLDVKTYGKDVDYMLDTPTAQQYYLYITKQGEYKNE